MSTLEEIKDQVSEEMVELIERFEENPEVEPYLETELDGDVAFYGETLADFIVEMQDLTGDESMETINMLLEQQDIEPIEYDW